MKSCPFSFILRSSDRTSSGDPEAPASNLRVLVKKCGKKIVDVWLPAHSARWLMDLIPEEVLEKIHQEQIPIVEIQKELEKQKILMAREIFKLNEEHRSVHVWLE